MAPKKILAIITTIFVPTGGLTTVAMNYYKAMDRAGLQMDFASFNTAPKTVISELDQCHDKYICLPDRKNNSIKYMVALYKMLKEEAYDIVHIHGNSATMVTDVLPAYLAGIKKRIGHVHNTQNQHSVIHFFLKPILNLLLTDRLAVSEKAGKYLYGNHSFEVLNNAINLEHYQYDQNARLESRRQWGIPESSFVVGTVGKMSHQKNQIFLLEIFARVLKKKHNAKLLIVGDGKLRKKIEEKIDALGIRNSCILAGLQNDTAPFLAAMDVFVLPSIYEGLSLSLIEAQAAGLKCYCTDSLAQEGIVAETCFCLNLNDFDGWIQAIACVENYNRVKTSAENIRRLREKGFDIKSQANQLRNIYFRQ